VPCSMMTSQLNHHRVRLRPSRCSSIFVDATDEDFSVRRARACRWTYCRYVFFATHGDSGDQQCETWRDWIRKVTATTVGTPTQLLIRTSMRTASSTLSVLRSNRHRPRAGCDRAPLTAQQRRSLPLMDQSSGCPRLHTAGQSARVTV